MSEESDEGVRIYDAASVAISASDKAQIDIQIATAKQYPRSIDKCLKEAESLATMDQDTASSMFYSLPRGKHPDGSAKFIEGPSVRLAEIIAFTWTNLRVQSGVVAEDQRALTAQATCFDIERNVAVRVDVKRSITGKYGRFNDDMIGVTGNAAISIALRNAVFKIVPRVLVDRIYGKARQTAIGDLASFAERRNKFIEGFTKTSIAGVPVTEKEVFAVLGVNGMEDILQEQYLQLVGLYNSIKSGETTLKRVFRPDKEKVSDGAARQNEALAQRAAATAAPVADPAPAPDAVAPAAEAVPAAAAPVDAGETEAERDARLAEDARIAREDAAREQKKGKKP